MPNGRRLLALGGIVGPVGFVAAWVWSGVATAGYSPVHQAISRLAALGAPTRVAMTAGLVCFGLGVSAYSVALRASLPGRAWMAAATTGLASLGVASFALNTSSAIDNVHAGFATVGYASLALTPLLAAHSLTAFGQRRERAASLALGSLCAVCLAATALGPAHGLFQRIGLTLGDLWLVASAIAILGW